MAEPLVGVLLCGGAGRRFGGGKLLAGSPPIALRALANLRAALPRVIAVVPETDAALASALREGGADVVASARTARGMGASLAVGVGAAPAAAGWLVALGDMPAIAPATHAAVLDAIAAGAVLAAAFAPDGRRGHPVAFSAALREALAALDGDLGARDVVASRAAQLRRVVVDDPGIFIDIDTPEDLGRAG